MVGERCLIESFCYLSSESLEASVVTGRGNTFRRRLVLLLLAGLFYSVLKNSRSAEAVMEVHTPNFI
jgi:hypothetical protein